MSDDVRQCGHCGGWIDDATNRCEDCDRAYATEMGLDDYIPWLVGVAVVLLAIVVILAIGRAARSSGPARVRPPAASGAPAPERPAPATPAPAPPPSGSAAELIRRIAPSVVAIHAKAGDGESQGSGFLFGAPGRVVTNAHVIQGARSLEAVDHQGRRYPAKLIGVDTAHDLALLAVTGLTGTPLTLDIAPIEQGDDVLAFGSPLGLENTVTTGIISGIRRDMPIKDATFPVLLQTTAPIAPGSSGGPLVRRSNGQVIGVNTAGIDPARASNIGFAIPASLVEQTVGAWESR